MVDLKYFGLISKNIFELTLYRLLKLWICYLVKILEH